MLLPTDHPAAAARVSHREDNVRAKIPSLSTYLGHREPAHTTTATKRWPSLRDKDVHPHVLRHSCAMSLLQAGVDTSVIALWLGHAGVRSTDAYVHAAMPTKEKALALTTPPTAKQGRYRPTGTTLAFLDSL